MSTSVSKIQVGQLWKKDGTGDIYLVTRLYSEALNTMVILRKSGAEDEMQIRVRVERAVEGQKIPGFSPAQGDEKFWALDRPNFHVYNIFDLHQLFLQERLAVIHADHLAVVPRQLIHLHFELVDSEVDFALLFGLAGPELRGKGQDCRAAPLVLGGDVHYEGGPHVV